MSDTPFRIYHARPGEESVAAENEQLRQALSELSHVVRQVQQGPLAYAVVIKVRPSEGRVVLAWGGNLLEVHAPIGLQPGDIVRASMDKFIIVDRAPTIPSVGAVRTVRAVVADSLGETLEVEEGMGSRITSAGRFAGKIAAGDRVVLDTSGCVVTHRLPAERSAHTFEGTTGIAWDDIAGLEQAKRDLREAIELPLLHPKLFAAYGRKPVKGVLLYGAPGNGKTLLGKAVATAISGRAGASGGFLYVKGPELLNSFVGQSEANVRALFAAARKHKAATGRPCVVFVDEADALVRRRGGLNAVRGMESTIVPQFLAEMDGLDESAAVVILSTNRPDDLDAAVVREGRIDRKVRVPRPDRAGAEAIARLYLAKVPLERGLEVPEAAELLAGELFAELPLWEVDFAGVVGTSTAIFGLSDVTSGAMVAGMVDDAASLALHRDLDAGAKVPSRVQRADLSRAVARTYVANFDLDHREDLDAWAHERGGKVVAIRKAHRRRGGP